MAITIAFPRSDSGPLHLVEEATNKLLRGRLFIAYDDPAERTRLKREIEEQFENRRNCDDRRRDAEQVLGAALSNIEGGGQAQAEEELRVAIAAEAAAKAKWIEAVKKGDDLADVTLASLTTINQDFKPSPGNYMLVWSPMQIGRDNVLRPWLLITVTEGEGETYLLRTLHQTADSLRFQGFLKNEPIARKLSTVIDFTPGRCWDEAKDGLFTSTVHKIVADANGEETGIPGKISPGLNESFDKLRVPIPARRELMELAKEIVFAPSPMSPFF